MSDLSAIDFLPVFFFVAAALYSSVGHAGASGYIATMALLGIVPDEMKPTALVLNVCVSVITTVQFARAGAVDWRRLLPYVAGSIPGAFVAAKLPVPPYAFKAAVGFVLACSALRLFWTSLAKKRGDADVKAPHAAVAAGTGAGIGVLAGITGTGGGIFLTPTMLFLRWAEPKTCAGMSAAFILVNSLAGLAGKTSSLAHLPANMPVLVVAVVAGGFAGSTLGTRVYGHRALSFVLGCVLVFASLKMFLR